MKPINWLPVLLALLLLPPVALTIEYSASLCLIGDAEEELSFYISLLSLVLALVICVLAVTKITRLFHNRDGDHSGRDQVPSSKFASQSNLNSLAGLCVLGLLALYVPSIALRIYIKATGDIQARWEVIRFLPAVVLVLVFLLVCLTAFAILSLKKLLNRNDSMASSPGNANIGKLHDSV